MSLQNLLILSAPVFLGLSIWQPRRALLLWMLISPLSTDHLFSAGFLVPDFTLDRLYAALTFLGILLSPNVRLKDLKPQGPFEKSCVTLLIIWVLEIGITFRPKDASIRTLSLIDSLGLPLYIYIFTRLQLSRSAMEDKVGSFYRVVICVGIYLAVLGIYEGLTLNDVFARPENRFTIAHGGGLRTATGFVRVNGPYFTPETFGSVLAMLFFIVLLRRDLNRFVDSSAGLQSQLLTSGILALLAGGLYFNMFRNFWIAVSLGLSARWLRFPAVRTRMVLAAIIATIVVAVGWGVIKEHRVYKARVAQTDTFYSRVGAYKYALRAFSEHPFLGIGWGRLDKYIEHAYERGDIIKVMGVRSAMQAHNTYLSILAEQGLVVFVPYLVMLVVLYREISRIREARDKVSSLVWFCAAECLFIVYTFPMLFDKTGYYGKINIMFFFLLSLVFFEARQYMKTGPAVESGCQNSSAEIVQRWR